MLLLACAWVDAETVYFVVGEFPGREVHHDANVIALEQPDDIAHARALSSDPERTDGPLVVCQIAEGGDGINRNYAAEAIPVWSWKVTEFLGCLRTLRLRFWMAAPPG